jgi:hypothetical protein
MHAPEHNHLNTPGSLKHLKSVALRFLGLMADLDPKGEGDNSMPGK